MIYCKRVQNLPSIPFSCICSFTTWRFGMSTLLGNLWLSRYVTLDLVKRNKVRLKTPDLDNMRLFYYDIDFIGLAISWWKCANKLPSFLYMGFYCTNFNANLSMRFFSQWYNSATDISHEINSNSFYWMDSVFRSIWLCNVRHFPVSVPSRLNHCYLFYLSKRFSYSYFSKFDRVICLSYSIFKPNSIHL